METSYHNNLFFSLTSLTVLKNLRREEGVVDFTASGECGILKLAYGSGVCAGGRLWFLCVRGGLPQQYHDYSKLRFPGHVELKVKCSAHRF
jgi:hypothetical protein